MPLTAVNTLTSVYATAPGGQTGYNDIRSVLVDVIGTGANGYGYQSIASADVSTSNLISASDWTNLVDNLSRIYRHQNTSSYTFTNIPSSGGLVRTNFVNQCISLLNDATDVKRYARPVDPTQRSTYDSSSQWTESLPSRPDWGVGIEHEITLTWPSASDARYFFNLGGRLSAALTNPLGPYTPADQEWADWINDNAATIAEYTYTRADYLLGSKAISYSDPDTGNTITITYTRVSDSVIRMSMLLNPTLATTLEVTNTFTYEYSIGAITAPQPSVTLNQAFGDSYTPIVTPTKILAVTTPSAYSWQTGLTSAAQTISITNNGNTTATVSSITFSNATGITQVTNFTGLGGTTNFTLDPSQTRTFTLAYTGSTVGGPYSSSFTVNSDNDSGAITILTSQSITSTPFSVTVTPSPVTQTIEGFSSWRQEFLLDISPADAEVQYSAVFASTDAPPGSIGWGFERNNSTAGVISGSNLKTGPSIVFAPAGASTTPYVASAVITMTFFRVGTSDTVTQTVNVTLNWSNPVDPVATQNLGTWVSPLAPNNSVIGMSYDLINGERYLTIGIGMGADGSVPLAVGGDAFVSVANLGIDADPDFRLGQPQYAATSQDSRWNLFLKNLSVWPNTVQPLPLSFNVGITPSYKIQITSAGTYNYQYSSDDDTQFYFVPVDQYGIWDGVTSPIFLPNQLMTGGATSNWSRSYFGSVYLEAGYYLIRWFQNNLGRFGGAAFELTDSLGNIIWNTRYPIRSGPVYLYWHEVIRFRIPADGTPRSMYDFYNYVKNSYQVQNRTHWGYFFSGGLFGVSDDGSGNITVSFFGTPAILEPSEIDYLNIRETIRALPWSFYYYIPNDVLPRYTNLDAGPTGDGTQTRMFTGFDRSGNVTTVLTSIPTSAPYPPFSSGGGGGVDAGGRPIDPILDPFARN